MKKFSAFVFTYLIISLQIFAQVDSLEIDSVEQSFEEQVSEVFSTLDMSEVTTGLLINKSFPLGYINRFTGL